MLRFTREELYNLVWSTPMSRLAEQLGVSDVGLAKACRRANIPLPGPGYWAKLQHGHKMERNALPQVGNGAPSIVTVSPGQQYLRLDDLPADIKGLVVQEANPDAKVSVIKTLAKPHPLIRSWLREAPKKQERSAIAGPADGQPPTKAGRRRLRILSSLLSALEARGHKILVDKTDSRNVALIVGGERVEFSLTERLQQISEELTDRERSDPFNYGRRFRVVQKPTGELTLKIHLLPGAGVRTGWRDRPGKPLEGKLNSVTAGLLMASAVVRKQRLDREESERQWRERERLRLEAEEAQRKETQRRNELTSQVTRWRQAEEIRHYIKAVHSLPDDRRAAIGIESVDEWASWASGVADEIDPLTHQKGRA